ncbi:hypothetical protein B1757_03465 [Acidithiobacillus marinus]|uniref:SpoVT-AbrB domain-containing protein n=1 Tax=Acidithiobacillus marinus TaxID=187490 RepID=A0A2I1DPB5_9PROT|nr:AbrB/MazE/SpoVT family DNA-binding domain-containing protein [Acidithiobacillus marinus]PKY11689.1 hypothetical protein B1757_03465 [Acidithiobacillus marinus]
MDIHPYNIHVDQRGRLVLPAVVRQRVGIEQGGTLILTLQDDGMLRLTRPEEAVRRSRGLLHTLSTDDSTQ